MNLLFRAIPASQFTPDEKHFRQNSKRFPSNIPYVVDNVLEWLRPDHMPCRRHAVYASPSVALALANASSPLAEGDQYQAFSLAFIGNGFKQAQLQVKDARYHSDVKKIQQMAIARFSRMLQGDNAAEKSMLGVLFMPGSTKDELNALYRHHHDVEDFLNDCKEHSKFWQSASNTVSSSSDGELFFEITDDKTYYSLIPQVAPVTAHSVMGTIEKMGNGLRGILSNR